MIKSHLLYQLSYVPKTGPGKGERKVLFPRYGGNFDTYKNKNQEKLFLNACRVRRMIVDKVNELFEKYDVLIDNVNNLNLLIVSPLHVLYLYFSFCQKFF